jgi:hypothetical protein
MLKIILSCNPLVALYTLQAFTYIVATVLARRPNHGPLAACYAVSAALHSLFAACHFLHL